MESPKKTNPQPINGKNESIYKGTIAVLLIIIGVLTFMLITGRRAMKEVATENIATVQLNTELRAELDSVLTEYNMVKNEYDSVLSRQDSIIQANAREIEKLIAEQSDYRRIRRQLNLLREITQNYVREIDSLYTENRVLKAENVEMQQEIQRVNRRTTELAQTKQILEGQVEAAAVLRAFQISATPLRLRSADREEETDRASRAQRIKVCFTVAANPVANAGNKNAYIRIADPKGNILRLGDDERYAFTHGKDTLQFTIRSQFNYINQDTRVCLNWDKNKDFEPGIYLVSVFTDQFRLGETQFSLR